MTTIAPPRDARAASHAIDSVRHPAARRIADVLRSKAVRPKVCIVDDVENIREAVRRGIAIDSVYTSEPAQSAAFRELGTVVDDGVPIHILHAEVVSALFGSAKHARTFALAHAPKQTGLRGLLDAPGDILVLDGVRLAGNIGAITRTASAFGAAGVVAIDSGMRSPFDRRLIRASRGLVFATPVAMTTRTRFADAALAADLQVVTFSADAPQAVSSVQAVRDRIALVFGSERDGVSAEVESLARHRFTIPMEPTVESLNVSVAAGIALHERGALR